MRHSFLEELGIYMYIALPPAEIFSFTTQGLLSPMHSSGEDPFLIKLANYSFSTIREVASMYQRKISIRLEKLRKDQFPVAVAVNDDYIVFAREYVTLAD